jgi:hypothetical protein
MSIELAAFDVTQLRARLRKMNDAELRRFGQAAKQMCAQDARSGKPPLEDYLVQLVEARAEWRRRHPKKSIAL